MFSFFFSCCCCLLVWLGLVDLENSDCLCPKKSKFKSETLLNHFLKAGFPRHIEKSCAEAVIPKNVCFTSIRKTTLDNIF